MILASVEIRCGARYLAPEALRADLAADRGVVGAAARRNPHALLYAQVPRQARREWQGIREGLGTKREAYGMGEEILCVLLCCSAVS